MNDKVASAFEDCEGNFRCWWLQNSCESDDEGVKWLSNKNEGGETNTDIYSIMPFVSYCNSIEVEANSSTEKESVVSVKWK